MVGHSERRPHYVGSGVSGPHVAYGAAAQRAKYYILPSIVVPVIIAFSAGGASFLIGLELADLVRLFWGLGGTFGGYLLGMIAIEYLFAAGYFTEVRRVWSMARSRMG